MKVGIAIYEGEAVRYDPVKEGSTEEALAYLEGSPAAAAAIMATRSAA